MSNLSAAKIKAYMGFERGEYNPKLLEDMIKVADPWAFLERVRQMNRNVRKDKERVRLQGEYYNNVHMGGHMFGPSRKQMFVESMMGGMERRFEIIDSQVNQISFQHTASDKFPNKCQSSRIKCSDKTRVVLDFKSSSGDQGDFIHANWIKSKQLFNTFIITQNPLADTVEDFWRMVWQEKARFIFMLNGTKDGQCSRWYPYVPNFISGEKFSYENLKVESSDVISGEPSTITTRFILLTGPKGEKLRVTHFQVDMNDSDDLETPLLLLRYARCSKQPTIVQDYLGISRAGVLVAIEICLFNLLMGPDHKNVVEHAIKELRAHRPYCVETPMQYIYIYRVVRHFAEKYQPGDPIFKQEYEQWLRERRSRMCEKEYRKLSPTRDPDLLRGMRRGERPTASQETHARIGELPEKFESSRSQDLILPRCYPGGMRYPC